jgi:hypothetical protein
MSTDQPSLIHRLSAGTTAGGLGLIPGAVTAVIVGWVRDDFSNFAEVVFAVAALFAVAAFAVPSFALQLFEGLLNVAIGFLNGAARDGTESPTAEAPQPMKAIFWLATVCGFVAIWMLYRY